MVLTVVLWRHGESTANKRLTSGESQADDDRGEVVRERNADLTDVGVAQAQHTGDLLLAKFPPTPNVHEYWCSPLRRAQQTLQEAGLDTSNYSTVDALTEIESGQLSEPAPYTTELEQEVVLRMEAMSRARPTVKTVILCGHSLCFSLLVHRLVSGSFAQAKITAHFPNSSLTFLRYGPGYKTSVDTPYEWQLHGQGWVEHLPASLRTGGHVPVVRWMHPEHRGSSNTALHGHPCVAPPVWRDVEPWLQSFVTMPLCKYLPDPVHPNHVTWLNAACVLLTLYLGLHASIWPADCGSRLWWFQRVGCLCGTTLSLVLDALDGDLARHTRQRSLRGAALDHGVDSFAVPGYSWLFLMVMGYGNDPWLVLLGMTGAFYAYHLQLICERVTGRFWPQPINGPTAQAWAAVLQTVSLVMQAYPDRWDRPHWRYWVCVAATVGTWNGALFYVRLLAQSTWRAWGDLWLSCWTGMPLWYVLWRWQGGHYHWTEAGAWLWILSSVINLWAVIYNCWEKAQPRWYALREPLGRLNPGLLAPLVAVMGFAFYEQGRRSGLLGWYNTTPVHWVWVVMWPWVTTCLALWFPNMHGRRVRVAATST